MIAVIADIHGNTWALEAVLDEIHRRGITRIANLGDCVYGPLDPAGTLKILQDLRLPTVTGNEDRCLFAPDSGPPKESRHFVLRTLGTEGVRWLELKTRAPFEMDGMLLCHGTPDRDDLYLLERVTPEGVGLRDPAEVDELLAGTGSRVVLCAHSHVPAVVRTSRGITVINPGSVGLPAYVDDHPYPHRMECGNPYASFAIVCPDVRGVVTEHVCVMYDASSAARTAERNGRPDWSEWLLTGFARQSVEGESQPPTDETTHSPSRS
jgi:predicted phosphodiesterase